MPGKIDARLGALGLSLPGVAAAAGNYVPTVRTGNLVFVSGQITLKDGQLEYVGKVGRDFTVEQGQAAARLCALNILAQLKAAGAEIHGIAIRDKSEDVAAFLARNGNPFARLGKDDVSAVQLAIGSSGVPETFVVDGRGVIRYQHIGDIRPEQVPLILDKLKEAER